MTDNELLQVYVSLVPFLSEVLGPGTEIVIHDVSAPEHSLIAIGNNLSGRELGNPLTDLASTIYDRGTGGDVDYLVNYSGHSKGRDFLSSTYCIKNKDKLIGLLCINKDMSSVKDIHRTLQNLLEKFNLAAPAESDISEELENPVTDLLRSRIAEIIAQSGIQPARMSRAEKIRVVHRLNENGIMMLRGAVAEIAKQLQVSIPSVYRYLNTRE